MKRTGILKNGLMAAISIFLLMAFSACGTAPIAEIPKEPEPPMDLSEVNLKTELNEGVLSFVNKINGLDETGSYCHYGNRETIFMVTSKDENENRTVVSMGIYLKQGYTVEDILPKNGTSIVQEDFELSGTKFTQYDIEIDKNVGSKDMNKNVLWCEKWIYNICIADLDDQYVVFSDQMCANSSYGSLWDSYGSCKNLLTEHFDGDANNSYVADTGLSERQDYLELEEDFAAFGCTTSEFCGNPQEIQSAKFKCGENEVAVQTLNKKKDYSHVYCCAGNYIGNIESIDGKEICISEADPKIDNVSGGALLLTPDHRIEIWYGDTPDRNFSLDLIESESITETLPITPLEERAPGRYCGPI